MFFCQSSAAAQGLAVLTLLLVWWMIMITFPILRAHLFPWGFQVYPDPRFGGGSLQGPGFCLPWILLIDNGFVYFLEALKHSKLSVNARLNIAVFWAARKFLGLPDSIIFQNFGTKSECPIDFGSFGKIFTWPKWLRSWGSRKAM